MQQGFERDIIDPTDKLFQFLRSKKSEEEKCRNVLSCLENGAKVNATDAKKKNNTPLHIAVQNNDIEIVKLLLDWNADINIKNDLKKNPLELANSLPEVEEDILILLNAKHKQIDVVLSANKKTEDAVINDELLIHEKREGTASGLSGQFYETKLLSLILFRCLTEETIVNFYLGTNLKNVGDLDDVCLKYEIKGETKPRMLFIQAKHREQISSNNKITLDDLKNSDDFMLTKYFDSYKKIRDKCKNSKDVMFNSAYEDLECDFVIFTPSKNDIDLKYKKNSIIMGNHRFEKLLCTRDNINNISEIPRFDNVNETFQISNENLLLDQILYEHIESLSKILKTHILENNDKTYKTIMTMDIIKKYHIILAQSVFQIQNSNDQCTENLKVCASISKDTLNMTDNLAQYVASVPAMPNNGVPLESTSSTKNIATTKSTEIFQYWNFRAEFFRTKDKFLSFLRNKLFSKSELKKMNSNSTSFKLPLSFGNIDLTVKENKKIKRIEYLTRTIMKLIKKSEKSKIVKINQNIFGKEDGSLETEDQINTGFIEIEGGIAGLVGNLLLFNIETGMFHISDTEDNLKGNSKLLLSKLKTQCEEQLGHKNCIYEYKFDIDINDFPKVILDCDKREKLWAKDYLSRLWFLTNQCQQSQLQTIVKMEMECQYRQEHKNRLLRIQSDAIFLKFHEKVQEWWMTKNKSKYITSNCDYYEKSKQEIIDSPILTILNIVFYSNVTKNQNIKFKEDAVKSLDLQSFLSDSKTNTLNIISMEIYLTVLKLAQKFDKNENTVFLDFEYILENGYYEMMKSELETTKLNTIVFIVKKQEHIPQICKLLSNIMDCTEKKNNVEQIIKKIVVVSQNNISNAFEAHLNIKYETRIDKKFDFNDILDSDTASQNWTLTFQGQKVMFNEIFEGDSKRLVNSNILSKFINNEPIAIGKPLANNRYDEVKQYCIPRNLTRKEECSIKTFKDINENVVLIVSEPGMGKSVLMNQLALQTKEFERDRNELRSWIVFVNLRDYSSDFKVWKDNLHIDKNEALRFVCKAAIDNLGTNNERNYGRGQRRDMNAFKLTGVRDDFIQVKSYIKDNLVSFELQLFIEYYNKGNVTFIFDGFDEICPQYEKQVSSLLKELTKSYHLPECELLNPVSSITQNAMQIFNKKAVLRCSCPLMGSKQQRIWVTSRSYNNIKNELESDLGRTAFTLKPLSKAEQTLYLMGYFEINFSLSDLTADDIVRLCGFLDYMLTTLSDENRHLAMVSVPLYSVYVTCVKYFHNKLSEDIYDIDLDISDLKRKCADAYSVLISYGPVFERQENIRELTVVSENPLHLYMAAEYFCSQIKEQENQTSQSTSPEQWDINIKSFDLFEKFIDTKFKKIRFEDKNDVDTSRSDVDLTLKREKIDFVEKHMKMALCAVFDRKDLKQLLPENFFEELDEIMIKINTGEEKTGVVVGVIDKVPRFVHLVFAEYFAIEYVSELLKSASRYTIEYPTLEALWRFIINIVLYKSTGGVRTFFNHKLRNDSDLINLINNEQNYKIVFKSLIKQGNENQMTPEGFNSSFKLLRTSLNVAVEESLFDIQEFMINTIGSCLNEDNVNEFNEMIANSLLVFSALGSNNDDFMSKLKSFVDDMPDSDTKFINMVLPTFAQAVIPFSISANTIMSTWNVLSSVMPQLANVNLDSMTFTPLLRGTIMDFLRLLRDLVADVYHF